MSWHFPRSLHSSPRWLAAWRVGIVLFVSAVFVTLAWRQHEFTDQFAVNMMIQDQWAFYTPMFDGGSWWDLFDYQHGPHRQGIGFLLTRMVANHTRWNGRGDAFEISFVLMIAAALAVLLALRCGAGFGIQLAAIPLLYFNVHQYENFVGASNVCLGAMPVLLITLYSLAWFIRSNSLRLFTLSALCFLLIFSGFGLFMGLVHPTLLLLEGYQAVRQRQTSHIWMIGGALMGVILFWLIFAHGYRFNPAAPDFHFPYEKPIDYLYFAGLMLGNAHGLGALNPLGMGLGVTIFAALATICSTHARRLFRDGVINHPVSAIIFVLSGFTVIYCAATAVGRVAGGLRNALITSRYVTLMIPGGLAIFLHLATLARRNLAVLLSTVYALLLFQGATQLTYEEQIFVHWFHDGRLRWKQAYLETHDEDRAAAAAKFAIYPESVHNRLQFLEQHQDNLFNPDGKP